MSDLLERGTKISMLRAHLNVSMTFAPDVSVVDRDCISALQVRCNAVDPIKRSLIEVRLVAYRALNENKFVRIEPNQSLTAATDQTHRHSVQQLIGKMDTHECFQRIAPFDFVA